MDVETFIVKLVEQNRYIYKENEDIRDKSGTH